MPKAFAAQFSDIGPSTTNPTGIWSPAYLRLKLALERGDSPDNVTQALYDWLSEKKVTPSQVDKILELPSAEHAYEALVQLIGGKLQPNALPPSVKQTLNRAIQLIAQRHVDRGEQELNNARARLSTMKGKFADESVKRIVDRLLA